MIAYVSPVLRLDSGTVPFGVWVWVLSIMLDRPISSGQCPGASAPHGMCCIPAATLQPPNPSVRGRHWYLFFFLVEIYCVITTALLSRDGSAVVSVLSFPGCVCWCNIPHPPSCCFQPSPPPPRVGHPPIGRCPRTGPIRDCRCHGAHALSSHLPARVDRLRSPTLVLVTVGTSLALLSARR